MSEARANNDYLIIGQQAWDTEIGSNCKNIALELSKHNRVLYINSPLDRITLLRGKDDAKIKRRLSVIHKQEEGLIKIQDNLWNLYPDCMVESINWINNHALFNFLNRRNNRKLARSIQKALTQLDFKNIILFNDNEIFKGFYLKDMLKPALGIYYSRDYMIAVDYWKKHGEKLEPELIAKNDLCVANSTFLAEYCRQYNPDSYYIGQGCDLGIFTPDEHRVRPKEIADLKGPVIGYVGALQSIRLDIAIIAHIASSRPDWNIVLVGPEDDVFKNSELHGYKNIVFTGMKPMEDLPTYIASFDVCINPQLVNQVTIGNYPRKIDEYLAMGKPVVATNTMAMEIFNNYAYLADTKEQYIELIEHAFREDSTILHEERRRFALEHTWGNSVGELYRAIDLNMKAI